jgi:hypothetical protein
MIALPSLLSTRNIALGGPRVIDNDHCLTRLFSMAPFGESEGSGQICIFCGSGSIPCRDVVSFVVSNAKSYV